MLDLRQWQQDPAFQDARHNDPDVYALWARMAVSDPSDAEDAVRALIVAQSKQIQRLVSQAVDNHQQKKTLTTLEFLGQIS